MRRHTLPRPACVWCEGPITEDYFEDGERRIWHEECVEDALSCAITRRYSVALACREAESTPSMPPQHVSYLEIARAVLRDLPTDPDPARSLVEEVFQNLVRTCRECGCTDDAACPGGCWWVEEDLCSACEETASIAPPEGSGPENAPAPSPIEAMIGRIADAIAESGPVVEALSDAGPVAQELHSENERTWTEEVPEETASQELHAEPRRKRCDGCGEEKPHTAAHFYGTGKWLGPLCHDCQRGTWRAAKARARAERVTYAGDPVLGLVAEKRTAMEAQALRPGGPPEDSPAAAIRRRREALCLTPDDLAFRASLPLLRLLSFELGHGTLMDDELRRIEAALRTAEERDPERPAEIRGAEVRANGSARAMAGPAYTRVG